MFARISQVSVPPERQEQALRAAEEHIGPALNKMQLGYCGDLLLGDRERGKMLAVTGGTVETVHHYEVYRAQNLGGTSSS